ncbi:MAG: metal-dependent transcriptional regulator [Clostridia bacterium]|nr:metal-dependent transcriptional regulator [Clostridia bacterium]
MTVHNDVYISKALADYLEAIYTISKTKSNVRTTDIALKLGISKPSVNRAVNSLKKYGLVTHEPYGVIILTEKGLSIGDSVSRRHRMIKEFLINVLRLTDKEADKEACQIEHNISQSTVEKMRLYMEH